MRTIIKNPSHPGYKPLAGRVPPSTSKQATEDWGNFNSRRSVLNALLAEQYHLCCYSEIRADEEGLGYHIEHIENKSQRPARTFDPNNLAASGVDADGGFRKLKQEAKGLDINLFGGHALLKTQPIDFAKFIHPHQPDCATYFSYLSDGRVIPRFENNKNPIEWEKADYTINTLNLNSPYLVRLRRTWWHELATKTEQHADELAEHPEKYREMARCDLIPIEGKLSRFFSVTRQFFGPVAEAIWTSHASDGA